MIYLNAGHNNNDSGTIGVNGVKESDLTIELRDKVINYIKDKTQITIDKDNDNLRTTLSKIKSNNKDVCIEIHFNSYDTKASGTLAIIDDNATTGSKLLAIELSTKISEVLKIKNRSVITSKESHRGTLAMPKLKGYTTLLEICFIDNIKDYEAYRENINNVAKIIAETAEQYNKY